MQGDWRRFEQQLHKMVGFDFTGLHKEIGEALVSSTKKRFKTETGPDGKKWEKSLRAKNEGGQTLTDNATLKNSITYKAKPDGVAVGTNVKYAAVHQGDNGKDTIIKAKRKKALYFRVGGNMVMKKQVRIPARPFLGINDDDIEEITGLINDRIKETLR